jgi:hypothetical protein
MSALFRGPSDHDLARELAAWRMDGLLEPAEEAWLDEHLAGCDACAAAAADYATDRLLLQGLRDRAPEPPRDLWARTSAALEAEAAHRAPRLSPARTSSPGRPGWILAPVAGLAIVAVAVGTGLLNGQPAVSPSPEAALATPMLVAADIQVLGQGEDGQLEILTRNVREVCPVGADACSAVASSATEPLAAMAQAPEVKEAILSPSRDRLVIVQGGEDGQGVYVVPVAIPAGSQPTGSPAAPTAPVTPAPAATAAPVETAAPSSPGTTSPPVASTSPEPPDATPAPADTLDPAASPTPDPGTTTPPVATPEPVPTPAATEAPATPEPTPSVDVTPGPDGAIQIASDVVVVGPVAAYNRAGTRFAFTARPADGAAGPDVYVWNTSEPRARAVTTDHRSVFAGWHSGDLVVSRVGERGGRTWLVDPVDGTEAGPVSDGWLPTISPDRRAAAWWDGSVKFGRDGVTPVTGAGDLVLGPWGRDGEAQRLVEGPLRGWSVGWDPSGSVLAVWTAGPNDDEPGSLSLYRVAADGRSVDLERPIRADEPAFDGFALDTDHLAWSTTSDDGKPVVRVLAWNDEGVGVVELPSEDGGTIVR